MILMLGCPALLQPEFMHTAVDLTLQTSEFNNVGALIVLNVHQTARALSDSRSRHRGSRRRRNTKGQQALSWRSQQSDGDGLRSTVDITSHIGCTAVAFASAESTGSAP